MLELKVIHLVASYSMYVGHNLKSKVFLILHGIGITVWSPTQHFTNYFVFITVQCKASGICGDEDSRSLNFMDMLLSWAPMGSLRKESIREDLGTILSSQCRSCHIIVKAYERELELLLFSLAAAYNLSCNTDNLRIHTVLSGGKVPRSCML